MKKNKEYNGHKSYSYWSQSLYINNDENLYYFAIECINRYKTIRQATDAFFGVLYDNHGRTPDNIKWTRCAVYTALMSLKRGS